ncbi:hypothetical protein QFC19_005802 [Naganishia cerealis]|uniref:Uncharacterized protein n=1 Tax=Naganishia cerealis TaxID=610337 RepID=A0ACC2VKN7_9TREE|nr:hypothetical protein QFC19_005802 [Naganishia cerealis]
MEKENRSTSDSAGNSAVPKLVLTYSIINEELEDIIGNILQEKSRYADDPLLAQQLVGHIMNSCLKNEIVARYVDNGDLRIEVPKSSLSKGVEEEIGTLQAFSVGRPIRAQISMTSSHSWADTPIANDLQMIYDIIVDRDNWLVSGNKRGTFQIGVGQCVLASAYTGLVEANVIFCLFSHHKVLML